ncbi:hypothetical protein MJO28_007414 [Puccinia striiformis f. sp. tritici]|uniref:Peptidase A1 domain-containing protein n=3 Tax=Puccinia striiformis TaxID=27350 RepID=A0A0L0VWA7_9BASI|nr:hypothetical protein Pst134EA_013526 [Puccinia striiformis f. sp. tritici]XP_047806367.1 hypothetical protein Pst134EA_013529 [Puccinia striiformis f. sp. tritici]KAI9603903.1 hypothetical protein H4Q26_003512 [Puccinia striiformis f. sp. tritici PST-130]KNF03457.1 hypothetical protein PSTG_03398 [Puccinia striiformis f. sp. tritici PST-78]POW10130.1 hypothetical protein PSTT_06361 [Puccinia striiformis]KAH9465643.1 hypothetical protein Pst134EA_013526 [Puccinia striiformis f. sp. tritici]
MSIRTPVFYQAPTGDFRQILGHGIARYGFFGFLNSNRATSDMGPYVQTNLPPQMQALSKQFLAKKKSLNKRGLKKHLSARLLQLVPAILGTVGQSSKLLMSPFLSTADIISEHFPGKNELAQDSSWGTATVKTDSLQGDLLWSTMVNLGSSSQPLRINIDTGSADFFVFDPTCETCALTNHAAFLYAKSTTFTPLLNLTFNAQYADGGGVNGYLAQDGLNFGGGVSVPQQLFGLATDVSGYWHSLGVDGLMGLGPDSLSSFPPPNNQGVFTQLLNNKALSQPVIGIALTKASVNSSGEFSFGKVNDQWIRGGASQLFWKNVSSQNFWGTELSGIFVDGANVMGSDDPPRAIVDTGTSLMLVSDKAAAGIHAKIPGAVVDPSNGIWRLPCSIANPAKYSTPSKPTAGSLFSGIFSKPARSTTRHRRESFRGTVSKAFTGPPNIFVELGSGSPKLGIPVTDLAYQAIPTNEANSLASDGRTAMCYSGIQAGADGFFVLGGTFIKNHYLALRRDGASRSIGFGNRKDLPEIL